MRPKKEEVGPIVEKRKVVAKNFTLVKQMNQVMVPATAEVVDMVQHTEVADAAIDVVTNQVVTSSNLVDLTKKISSRQEERKM